MRLAIAVFSILFLLWGAPAQAEETPPDTIDAKSGDDEIPVGGEEEPRATSEDSRCDDIQSSSDLSWDAKSLVRTDVFLAMDHFNYRPKGISQHQGIYSASHRWRPGHGYGNIYTIFGTTGRDFICVADVDVSESPLDIYSNQYRPLKDVIAVLGGGGNDIIYGTKENNLLYGDGGTSSKVAFQREWSRINSYSTYGNDRIYGRKGDDVLIGGYGNDSLFGGQGDDILRGGQGDDILRGGPGDDWLIGGYGRDTLASGQGADTFVHDAQWRPKEDENKQVDTIRNFQLEEDFLLLIAHRTDRNNVINFFPNNQREVSYAYSPSCREHAEVGITDNTCYYDTYKKPIYIIRGVGGGRPFGKLKAKDGRIYIENMKILRIETNGELDQELAEKIISEKRYKLWDYNALDSYSFPIPWNVF